MLTVVTTTEGRDRQGRELLARRFRGAWVLRRQNDNWMISVMRGLPHEEDRVVRNATLEAAEALEPQIRAFVRAYEDAFNTHDPSAVGAFYADDADLIVREGPVTHGQQAIRQWWETYFSEPRPYRAILIVDDIRMIAPDVAVVSITATGAVPQPEKQPLPARYARATWVVAREAGEWSIAALWVLPSEDDRIIRGGGRPS